MEARMREAAGGGQGGGGRGAHPGGRGGGRGNNHQQHQRGGKNSSHSPVRGGGVKRGSIPEDQPLVSPHGGLGGLGDKASPVRARVDTGVGPMAKPPPRRDHTPQNESIGVVLRVRPLERKQVKNPPALAANPPSLA
eukprot:164160-Prorocentrum_minimum.AAC.1